MSHPLLYYITDRTQFRGDESTRRERLLEKIAEAAQAGVDYIQLREKDLSTRELEHLAREALTIVRAQTQTAERGTALLINSRTDVALAIGVHGVHLPANDVSPNEVRHIATRCTPASLTISISCHHPKEVHAAQSAGADLVLFAPVFEKKDAPTIAPAGLEALRQASQYPIPVLALGGVTLQNADLCFEAGAAGIAAIRLFQENSISEIVHQLRRI